MTGGKKVMRKFFIQELAEGMRFELTKQFYPFTRFPGERLQPLGHPSAISNHQAV